MPRSSRVLLIAAVAFALSFQGCGEPKKIPLSSHADPVGVTPESDGYRITLSANTPVTTHDMRLTKPAPLHRKTVSRVFFPEERGKMDVGFDPYVQGDRVQLRRARLKVKENAVLEPIEITMKAVSGRTLDDIEVIFQPHGFEFERPATLVLRLIGNELTSEDILAYHISGANIDQIGYEFDEDLRRDVVRVVITVPGFSRYSLGGGQ